MDKLIREFRGFVCFNQKQTIKYEYLISEHHKELKNYFNDPTHTSAELKAKYHGFIVASYTKLLQIFEPNKDLINKIYLALGKATPPRITIKTIIGDDVLNIYRSSRRADFGLSAIKDNTGFSEILHHDQLCYLENNLQQKFAQGEYVNPRLIEANRQQFKDKKIDWKDCWQKSKLDNGGADEVEYYSSTLILPMSIRCTESDKGDGGFYNHFFDGVEHGKDFRTVWGFLCFDSVDTDYFVDKDEVVDMGYIMADILSLYLMAFYTHVSGSQTIRKIQAEITPPQNV
jgi:hypothetical protein